MACQRCWKPSASPRCSSGARLATAAVRFGSAIPCPTVRSASAGTRRSQLRVTARSASPMALQVRPSCRAPSGPSPIADRGHETDLHDHQKETHGQEHDGDGALGQPEAAIGEQRERRLEAAEGADGEETDEGQRPEPGEGRRRRGAAAGARPPGPRRRRRFGKAADGDHGVDEGDGSGHHERQVRSAERRQPTDGRPDDEADPERRAQHAEKTRAVGLRGDVGDRALGHGHAGPGHPVDDPAGEQHPERHRRRR